VLRIFAEREDLQARRQWLTPVILATQESKMRRTVVQSQPGQIVHETYLTKNPSQKRAGRVAQGVGTEFKSQYHQKKKKITMTFSVKQHVTEFQQSLRESFTSGINAFCVCRHTPTGILSLGWLVKEELLFFTAKVLCLSVSHLDATLSCITKHSLQALI
jgi:hypothetical protein